MKIIQNYINGKKTNLSNKFLEVQDPSTGEDIAKVVLSNYDDFLEALNSSKKSQLDF